jgi:hypothetical protein
VVTVVWNVIAAGRIVHDQRAPRSVVLTTAFGALLLVPALIVAVATASSLYGRGIQPLAWIWPAVALLIVIQAGMALARGLVNPLLGAPILVYDTIIAIVAVGRYLSSMGVHPPFFTLVVSAAYADTLGIVGGPETLWRATWVLVPLFSPALRSRSRLKAVIRSGLAVGVVFVTAFILLAIPRGVETIRSYDRFAEQTPEDRPAGDFDFGLQVFPELHDAPPPVAIENDLPIADSLGLDAISVIVDPEALRLKALDSLAHTLDNTRDDSTIVIVTLGYPRHAARLFHASSEAYTVSRLRDVDRIARALHPTVLIPAYEPYGAGERALGTLPVDYWKTYIADAAHTAHHVNPHIKVGLAAASYGPRDSALYAWAARSSSPVEWLGFSLMPEAEGGKTLDTHLRIAQRWMRLYPPAKPHWVWSAGGYPVTHGEQSQVLALRGVIAWATTQPAIKGVVVTEAGDYDGQRGLRAASGRLRPAVDELNSQITTIRASAQ